jgi:hypothetical protein
VLWCRIQEAAGLTCAASYHTHSDTARMAAAGTRMYWSRPSNDTAHAAADGAGGGDGELGTAGGEGGGGGEGTGGGGLRGPNGREGGRGGRGLCGGNTRPGHPQVNRRKLLYARGLNA